MRTQKRIFFFLLMSSNFDGICNTEPSSAAALNCQFPKALKKGGNFFFFLFHLRVWAPPVPRWKTLWIWVWRPKLPGMICFSVLCFFRKQEQIGGIRENMQLGGRFCTRWGTTYPALRNTMGRLTCHARYSKPKPTNTYLYNFSQTPQKNPPLDILLAVTSPSYFPP